MIHSHFFLFWFSDSCSLVCPEQLNCLLFFRKILQVPQIIWFSSIFVYLNPFQQWLSDFEIHLLTQRTEALICNYYRRFKCSLMNTKLALIWKEDFGPLGNSPVLLLSSGKMPLTTTVAKFLDTPVCGGSSSQVKSNWALLSFHYMCGHIVGRDVVSHRTTVLHKYKYTTRSKTV